MKPDDVNHSVGLLNTSIHSLSDSVPTEWRFQIDARYEMVLLLKLFYSRLTPYRAITAVIASDLMQ